jgi:4'-phosphopantetheinyl transferase
MIDNLHKRLSKLPKVEGLHCNVWLLDLSKIEMYEIIQAKKVLNSSELERCNSYQLHDLKAQYIISRMLMKMILASELGCSFAEIVVQYSDLGKPFLLGKHSECHFSYSDSHGMGLFAMSDSCVGVDFEYMDHNPEVLQTLSVIATPSEKQWVLERDYFERYYLLWTLKESYLKCLGTGLLGGLPEINAVIRKPLGMIHRLPGEQAIEMYSNYLNRYIYSLSVKRETL